MSRREHSVSTPRGVGARLCLVRLIGLVVGALLALGSERVASADVPSLCHGPTVAALGVRTAPCRVPAGDGTWFEHRNLGDLPVRLHLDDLGRPHEMFLGREARAFEWGDVIPGADDRWPSEIHRARGEETRLTLTFTTELRGGDWALFTPAVEAGQPEPRSVYYPDYVLAGECYDTRLRLRCQRFQSVGAAPSDPHIQLDFDQQERPLGSETWDGEHVYPLEVASVRRDGPFLWTILTPWNPLMESADPLVRDLALAIANLGHREIASYSHAAVTVAENAAWCGTVKETPLEPLCHSWASSLAGRLARGQSAHDRVFTDIRARYVPTPLANSALDGWWTVLRRNDDLFFLGVLLLLGGLVAGGASWGATRTLARLSARAHEDIRWGVAPDTEAAVGAELGRIAAALGLPLDQTVCGLKPRIVERLAEARLRAGGPRGGDERVETPEAVGLMVLEALLGLPHGSYGMVGELCGRSPLVRSLAARSWALLGAGRGGEARASIRAEAHFWRVILRDQYTRLEATRRSPLRPWRRPRGLAERSALFLGENLDDLYRSGCDPWASIHPALVSLGVDPSDPEGAPCGLHGIIEAVLRPLAPSRPARRGFLGLVRVASQIFKPSFWRPGDAVRGEAAIRRRAGVRHWAVALVSAGGVCWVVGRSIFQSELVFSPITLLALAFAMPCLAYGVVALMNGAAAVGQLAAQGQLGRGGDWLDARAQANLVLLLTTLPDKGASSWAGLVDHLLEQHLLTLQEHQALVDPPRQLGRGGVLLRPRNPQARERLRRWAGRAGEVRPAIPGWASLPALTWFVSAHGERFHFAWSELVDPKGQDSRESRLRYLISRYPDEWENLVDDLDRRCASQWGQRPIAAMDALRTVSRQADIGSRVATLPVGVRAQVISQIVAWCNRRLPTNWRLMESLSASVDAATAHARASWPDARYQRLAAALSGSGVGDLTPEELAYLHAVEQRIEADVRRRIQIILRDDNVRGAPGTGSADVEAARVYMASKGWEFAWFPATEVVHHSKYGGWARCIHRVRGAIVYGTDSHMELPWEEGPEVLRALGAFARDPDLAVLVAGIESYSTGFSDIGRHLGISESVWGAIEQRRKGLTDAPLNAGKSFIRVSDLLGEEGLQDDYVAEDAMTSARLMSAGKRIGFADHLRLSWRAPVNLLAAAVPLGKYAASSAEFGLGSTFGRFLASPRVPWFIKLGFLYNATFYLMNLVATCLVVTALLSAYALESSALMGLQSPLLFGVAFAALSQVLGINSLVYFWRNEGTWLKALKHTTVHVVRSFPFFNLLVPYYALHFFRGVFGRGAFIPTDKSPNVAGYSVDEAFEAFWFPSALGACLVPLFLLSPFYPLKTLMWAVTLLSTVSYLYGPYLYGAVDTGDGLWTGNLLTAIRGPSLTYRRMTDRLWGRVGWLFRPFVLVLYWLLVAPAGALILGVELLRQPGVHLRWSLDALERRWLERRTAALAALMLLGVGCTATPADERPTTTLDGAALVEDDALRWIRRHRAATGLVPSHVGDPQLHGLSYLADQGLAFDVLVAHGQQADALDLLEATWSVFPRVEGWHINAVDAQFGTVQDWRTMAGPNASLGRRAVVAFQLTGDERWLNRARSVADGLLARRQTEEAHPARGAVPAVASGFAPDAREQLWYDLEANLRVLTLVQALAGSTGDGVYVDAARGLQAFATRCLVRRGTHFHAGVLASGAPARAALGDGGVGLQTLALAVLGPSGAEILDPRTEAALRDWIEVHAAVRDPAGDVVGFEYVGGRFEAVSVVDSTRVLATMLGSQEGAEGEVMRRRAEVLFHRLDRLASGLRPYEAAYLPDGHPAAALKTGDEGRPEVPLGQSLSSVAHLDLLRHGWDPVGPLPSTPTGRWVDWLHREGREGSE